MSFWDDNPIGKAADYGTGWVTGGAYTPSGGGWTQGNSYGDSMKDIYTFGAAAPKTSQDDSGALSAEANALRNQGLAYGDSEFQKIYGTTKDQVGLDMQDIIQRRKNQLQQNSLDPVANAIRQSGNDQVRQANSSLAQAGQKGGLGAQATMAVKRQANRDVNSQLAQKYMTDLNANQQLQGNLATQSQRIPQVYAQIFQGGQYVPPVGQAPLLGGLFGDLFGNMSQQS